ncbi:unnamed protein product [Spirodela intermedia]|uniref:Tify domain-containing protein n=1 Tax=Spirodela intermedia TaxID=51605 RepID=A0A7I8J7U3_SPIIN|nr:unnamed protein product [Spirodela intermedia]CAA6666308.1 unnamed protein product [Spirodela intermedia]
MAVVSMGGTGDENGGNLVFHDFLGISHGEAPPAVRSKGGVGDGSRGFKVLGIADARASMSASVGASSGERGLVSRTSDLGPGSEVNNHFSGRKRANSDSAFMGFPRERMAPMASGSPESSSRLKVLPKEDPKEKQRRSSDDAVFGTQPSPRLTSTSLIIHQPLAGRADPVGSKWEQSMPLNSGAMMHYTSSFGQNMMQRDKLSSCTYKDSNTSVPLISPAAADEGSRTGTKNGRKICGALHCIDKAMASPRITDRSTLATANRQMTIFYAGQAHVFDDVPPNKLHTAPADLVRPSVTPGQMEPFLVVHSDHIFQGQSQKKLPAV